MNGIINVLKPPGMTSFDVVAYLRRILKTKKVGHTGTLDPGVAGVLTICIGNATKSIEYFTETDKYYRAELTLGISTDTQDSSGEIVRECKVDFEKDQIIEAINWFIGKYEQVPPMYSAVKVGGKKLYELARKGITVERKSREVEIYSINILDVKCINNFTKVLFDVKCSKGTYIRTLCSDIGEKLGCGGHMSFLIRTRAGEFDISTSLTLEEIVELSNLNRFQEKIFKTDSVFKDLNKIVLNGEEQKKLTNGVHVKLKNTGYKISEKIRVYDSENNFLALGEIIISFGSLYLKSIKSFWNEDN